MFTRLHRVFLNVKMSGFCILRKDLLSPYGFTREREIIPQDSIGRVVHQKLKFLLRKFFHNLEVTVFCVLVQHYSI